MYSITLGYRGDRLKIHLDMKKKKQIFGFLFFFGGKGLVQVVAT
jgi:hypothetical protein